MRVVAGVGVSGGFEWEARERRFLIRFLASIWLCRSWGSVSEAEMVFEIRNPAAESAGLANNFPGLPEIGSGLRGRGVLTSYCIATEPICVFAFTCGPSAPEKAIIGI